MNYLELSATALYVTSTVLASKNNLHTWWIGIVSCALFLLTFYQVKLYADAALQLFFIASSCYGWLNWKKSESHAQASIAHLKKKYFVSFIITAVCISMIYGYALLKMTRESSPFVDSLILMLSLLGQFLLIKRKIENWIVWFLVDVISIPLFISKGLYTAALLYIGLLIIAMYGYFNWKKEMKIK